MELETSIIITKEHSEYDECAKRLLSHKKVLARILTGVIEAFKDMDPDNVIPYIEGEPLVSKVPLNPGLTNNTKDKKIIGMNTEDTEVNEGLVRFDIIFYVRLPQGLSKVIINIEVQMRDPSAYHIINRAIFYTSRMISSQKGREFTDYHYDDIKPVYSIWICMHTGKSCTNVIRLSNTALLGNRMWKGNLGLFNIVLIGLPKHLPNKGEEYKLHRFLTGLLSNDLSVDEKMEVMAENGLENDRRLKERVATMCNLSEGVFLDGFAKGRREGRNEGRNEMIAQMILTMNAEDFSNEQIARLVKVKIERVEEVLALQAAHL